MDIKIDQAISCAVYAKGAIPYPGIAPFHFFLVLSSLLNLADGRFLHRNTAVLVITELYDHGIIGNVDHDAIETGSGQNAVTCL